MQIWVVTEVITEVIAEIAAEVNVEVAMEIAVEILIVRLNWGVGNLVYCYVVVQAGLGFNVDAGAILYLIVARR